MSKRDYERGIYLKGAFGRRDYLYVYEVAPWAYDNENDWLKVAIKDSIALDISDDWTRELGQVDLAKILGAAPSATNPLPSRLTDGTDYYDARDRTWNLGDSDVPDLKDRPTRQLGYVYGHLDQVLRQKTTTFDLLTYDDAVNDLLAAGLPTSLDTGALRVREQNWPASYPVTNAGLSNLDVLLSTRALEAGGNLASVKTNTDPLVAAAAGGYVRQDSTGTIAKEAGGNLASIKTNTDPLVAAAAGGYVRQDSTGTIAKETGGNLAGAATSLGIMDDWDDVDKCVTIPKAKGKTPIIKVASRAGVGTVTIYTVTAGKTFYLMAASLNQYDSAAAEVGSAVVEVDTAGDGVFLTLIALWIVGVNANYASPAMSVPLPFSAGSVFRVQIFNGANNNSKGVIMGWEE